MKILSGFAKVADKDKFMKDGYFTHFTGGDDGKELEFTEEQKEKIRVVYESLCNIDKLPTFDIKIELSTSMTMYDMTNLVTNKIVDLVNVESDKVLVNLELKLLDKLTNTWHTHRDKVLVCFTFSKLRAYDGNIKAEYTFMLKTYLEEIRSQHATDISADEIMNLLRLEV